MQHIKMLDSVVLSSDTDLQQRVEQLSHKYNMDFHQFSDYLHARSTLLTSGTLSQEQLQILGKSVMAEEDDWFDWKAAQDMLENWLGIR